MNWIFLKIEGYYLVFLNVRTIAVFTQEKKLLPTIAIWIMSFLKQVAVIIVTKIASSAKFVGEFRLRKIAHRMKQGDFEYFIAPKSESFSCNEIYFAI